MMQRTAKMRSPSRSDDSEAGPPATTYTIHNSTAPSSISPTFHLPVCHLPVCLQTCLNVIKHLLIGHLLVLLM